MWGDAKAGNIMVESKTDSAILIDFGGGITSGWVDWRLSGTKERDLQGLDRINMFIDGIDASVKSRSSPEYRHRELTSSYTPKRGSRSEKSV